MKRLKDIIKHSLLFTIFIVLWTPFAIQYFSNEDFFPLKGAVTLPSDIVFSKKEWISAEYQQKKEEYLNSSFGFRSLFVRLNNQIAFNLFKKAKANGVVIGKENYLYEEGYINACYGKDYLGEDSISHTINRFKFISDTLNKLGKQLIVVFAPGKGSFFSEYIPDSYLPRSEKTNYKTFAAKAKENQSHLIDFNKWFLDNKSISKYPLYSKQGVHWSLYGTALAADSLIKTIEKLRNIDAPNLLIDGVDMKPAEGVDYDIADGMNLLFHIKGFDVAYPRMQFVLDSGKTKPKVLVVSDSYYWGMYNLGIANCFQNDHFWYYNKQVFPESSIQETLAENQDFGLAINNHEVFVIISTEPTIRKISWGFIERAELHFKGKDKVSEGVSMEIYNKKVKEFVEFIKKNKKWFTDTSKRAKERNISIDSCLILEAMWQIDNAK